MLQLSTISTIGGKTMILRCQRSIEAEAISNNKLYPVIMYELQKTTHERRFLIVDDCRSLSWHGSERFDIISDNLECYIEEGSDEINIRYIHKELAGEDFFSTYYMEDEKSLLIKLKLEEVLISVLTNEITAETLYNNLKIIGFKDDNTKIVLKAFLNNADSVELSEFAERICDEVAELEYYIIDVIVEKLSQYKALEIERLFFEIYMCYQDDTKETFNIISKYLNI